MKKISIFLGIVLGFCFLVTGARASVIEQTAGTAMRSLEFYDPGQTFTAEDPLLETIEFELTVNTINTPATSLQVDLYTWDAGSSSLGTLVASALNDTELPVFQGGYSWVAFNFSGIQMTTGAEYAAVIIDPENDKWGYGVHWNNYKDLYAGGSALFHIGQSHGTRTPDENGYDLNFRVTASPVPVPAAVWLLGSGILGLVGLRRRSH